MIPIARPVIEDEEKKAVNEVLDSGWITHGKKCEEFEQKYASYIGRQYGIACSNGSAALHLVYTALFEDYLNAGCYVLSPSLTFISPIAYLYWSGLIPKFVDVHKGHWCIDADKIMSSMKEVEVTDDVKGILAVHLTGHTADMDVINEIAAANNLIVVEDVCEAEGALYKGVRAGALSKASVVSFYANKIITTGEGGMCLTNDAELARKIRELRDHGGHKDYRYRRSGFNYRLTDIQAAIGLAQLKKLDKWLTERKYQEALYKERLSKVPEVTFREDQEWCTPVNWIFSILVSKKRDELRQFLFKCNIETRPQFDPLHKVYKTGDNLPITEDIANRGVLLPTYIGLQDGEIEYICASIRKFYQ